MTELAREVNARCRLRGRFTLRSGQVSDDYFDKYLFEADPLLLGRVTGAMRPLIPDGTDLLGGLELGGIPLATMLSQATGIPHCSCASTPRTTALASSPKAAIRPTARWYWSKTSSPPAARSSPRPAPCATWEPP
jgi:orotate phosphoribosyltransferase